MINRQMQTTCQTTQYVRWTEWGGLIKLQCKASPAPSCWHPAPRKQFHWRPRVVGLWRLDCHKRAWMVVLYIYIYISMSTYCFFSFCRALDFHGEGLFEQRNYIDALNGMCFKCDTIIWDRREFTQRAKRTSETSQNYDQVWMGSFWSRLADLGTVGRGGGGRGDTGARKLQAFYSCPSCSETSTQTSNTNFHIGVHRIIWHGGRWYTRTTQC